jgi:hypothetical protein
MESDVKSLKWASIQRLPTVARLRRGLLTTPQGDTNEIDVHNIGLQETTYLLQRLVKNNINTDDDDDNDVVDNDQSSFLLKLMRDRIDRYACYNYNNINCVRYYSLNCISFSTLHIL